MRNTKNKKNKKLDLSDIDTKIQTLVNNTEKAIQEKDSKTPIQILLNKSKDTIIKARKNKISYLKISELIEEIFEYKISPQTISKFLEKNNQKKDNI